MAHGFSGDFATPCLQLVFGGSSGYLDHFRRWAEAAWGRVRGRLGCVGGAALHLWHGETVNRGCVRRYRELGETADEDVVLMALDSLSEHGLIRSGYDERDGAAVALSRRRFFRRVGVAGAAAVNAPVVYSIIAPTAAAALSHGGGGSGGNSQFNQPFNNPSPSNSPSNSPSDQNYP